MIAEGRLSGIPGGQDLGWCSGVWAVQAVRLSVGREVVYYFRVAGSIFVL